MGEVQHLGVLEPGNEGQRPAWQGSRQQPSPDSSARWSWGEPGGEEAQSRSPTLCGAIPSPAHLPVDGALTFWGSPRGEHFFLAEKGQAGCSAAGLTSQVLIPTQREESVPQ